MPSKKKGLPQQLEMRHDAHYVDALTKRFDHHVGKYVSIESIEPNPDQPRTQLGDLEELKTSILAKGVLEPLLVRPASPEGKYQLISGERRFHAAMEAGLDELPVVEIDASDVEVVEIALIENLQRKDLTPFEEADGYAKLMEGYGHTQEKIADVVGKARSSVAEALRLRRIPPAVRTFCRDNQIEAKSVLVEISRLESEADMLSLAEAIAGGEIADRAALREKKRQVKDKDSASPVRPYVFRWAAPDKPYKLQISFPDREASREDVISALESALKDLRSSQ